MDLQDLQTQNAQIAATQLGYDDHGIVTAFLQLQWPGMGGGFGGCTINLVKDDIYDKFVEDVTAKFTAKYGHAPEIYPVIISEGSHKVC